MKRLLFILLAFTLSGCASLTYQSPDGTKVTYTRLFTASDTIKGTLGTATIESQGQKIDATTLNAILNILGAVK